MKPEVLDQNWSDPTSVMTHNLDKFSREREEAERYRCEYICMNKHIRLRCTYRHFIYHVYYIVYIINIIYMYMYVYIYVYMTALIFTTGSRRMFPVKGNSGGWLPSG